MHPIDPHPTLTQCTLVRLRLATVSLVVTLTLLLLGFSRLDVTLAGSPPGYSYSPTHIPPGLSASEWAEITSQIQQGYYQVRSVEDGYRAGNPGQQWQTRFDGAGFWVRPDAGGWWWGLALRSYGYLGTERRLAEKAQASAVGQRVIYHWDDLLTEWYENDERGLKHGFTLHQRPEGSDQFLQLSLQVRGSLRLQVSPDRAGVDFVDRQGVSLVQYRDLYVYDAQGQAMPAWFEGEADKLRLVIDDRTARYPLIIDPIAQQAYLKASNTGAVDFFGYSVALSGDTLVVGAWREDSNATGVNGDQTNNSAESAGAAYVFTRSGSTWSQQAYLKASNTGAGDEFGSSVALSGDTLVVGANGEDSNATGVNGDQTNNSADIAGAAYIFTRSGSIWSQQAYLKASNTGSGDQFGISVALSGDTLVVGAFTEDSNAIGVNGDQANNSVESAGAAYVFTRSGSTWSQQAYLKASHSEAYDWFGYSVALSGDTLVVGATGEDSNATGVNGDQTNNSAESAGAAYIFTRSGSTWSQQAYLKASNTEATDVFGHSVALSGDTLVVGAYAEDSNATGVNGDQANNSADGAGAAYIFTRSGNTWSQQAYLKASNTGAGDNFGNSVALSGDTLAVGAYAEDSNATGVNGDQTNNSASQAGAVYVFTRSGSTWSQQAYLKASNTEAGDVFGNSVALSGDMLAVGAYFEASSATGVNGDQTNNSANLSGATYVFLILPDTAEMAVTGNGITIADGVITPSLANHTDFGSASLGGAITRTFTISNSGTTNLNLTSTPAVSITGPAAGDFSLVSEPSASVAVGNTTTFQVRFDPSVVGTRVATLTIANNDADENPYDFAIQGVGTATPEQKVYLPLILKDYHP
jgi:hypothetical protein